MYRGGDVEDKFIQNGVRYDAIFLKIMTESFQAHVFRALQEELPSSTNDVTRDSDLVANVFSKTPQAKVGKAAPYARPSLHKAKLRYIS